MFLELRVNALGGLGVPRETDDAADRPVESMGNAEVDSRRLVVLGLDVRLRHRLQAWHRRRRLRQQRRGLVDDEEVMILEEDVLGKQRFVHDPPPQPARGGSGV